MACIGAFLSSLVTGSLVAFAVWLYVLRQPGIVAAAGIAAAGMQLAALIAWNLASTWAAAKEARNAPDQSWSGAQGRTRTGMASRPGDFRTTTAFAAPRGFVAWSTPSPSSRDLRRPPSALYTFLAIEAWLGVVSAIKGQGFRRI